MQILEQLAPSDRDQRAGFGPRVHAGRSSAGPSLVGPANPLLDIAVRHYGRTSTRPAALKSPSNASASLMRRRRMTAKLVASTNE